MTFSSIRRSRYSQLISFCLIITFVVTMVITPRVSYAQGVQGLPKPGTMVNLSSSYIPLMLTGLTVHPENPLLMDFIVSTGNSGLNTPQVKEQSNRLIKYFLACLTIPENDQWVNLSPYEKQRIIPKDLGQTVLGQDMLAQDYILKQLTASLIYPEKNLGKNFWDKVYAKASQEYGTTQIPVNTFNKVWILPNTAKVYEHKDTVFIVKSHLKVMLDEDYLAMSKHQSQPGDMFDKGTSTNVSPSTLPNELGLNAKAPQVNHLGSQIIRQLILPAIEGEVNTGKNFANLRQIYNSMILAVWFKKNLKQALLNQVYTDKAKVNGVNVDDPAIKEKIYQQYLQAYKKGVFNYIKEEPVMSPDVNPMSSPNASVGDPVPATIARKYFSGGLTAVSQAMLSEATVDEAIAAFSGMPGEYFLERGLTQGASGNPAAKSNAAMTAGLAALVKGREILRSIQTNIERGYDVRGIAIGPKATMTPESLFTAGVALGLELNDRVQGRRPRVLVTGDQRSTTPALRQAVSEGLTSQGIDVDFTEELVSTPAANAVPRLPKSGYDAEVQITASHNAWTKYIASERKADGSYKEHDPENGFKINIREKDGQFRGVYGQGMWNILSRSFSAESEKSSPSRPSPREIKEVQVLDRYYDHLAELFKKGLTKVGLSLEQAQKELVLVVDTGNGVMGPIAKAVIQGRLGIQYVGIDDEVISNVNGIPTHEADPSHRHVYDHHLPEEVQKVAERPENQGKIVLGLAFDGDGDRFGMTDENGSQYLTPNQQGYFLFSTMKKTSPHSGLVLDIRAGQEILEILGLNAKDAKWHAPGWPVVRNEMQKVGADIAVEGSHHTMLRQFDDPNTDAIDDGLYVGLFAAIQALKLRTEGQSIHQLLDRTWYPTLVEELRPAVAESSPGDRYELMPQIAESLSKEVESAYQGAEIFRIPSPGERGAVRLQISSSNGDFIGWILMRASNTSPRLSMQAQGRDKQTITQLATIIGNVLAKFDKVNQADVQNVLAKTLANSAQLVDYAQDDEMSLAPDAAMGTVSFGRGYRPVDVMVHSAKGTTGSLEAKLRGQMAHLSNGDRINLSIVPSQTAVVISPANFNTQITPIKRHISWGYDHIEAMYGVSPDRSRPQYKVKGYDASISRENARSVEDQVKEALHNGSKMIVTIADGKGFAHSIPSGRPGVSYYQGTSLAYKQNVEFIISQLKFLKDIPEDKFFDLTIVYYPDNEEFNGSYRIDLYNKIRQELARYGVNGEQVSILEGIRVAKKVPSPIGFPDGIFLDGSAAVIIKQAPALLKHINDHLANPAMIGHEDKAVLAGVQKHNDAFPGGIDLNSRHLKMQSEGQKVDITFDPAMIAQFRRGDFSGVKFQIIDVVPINLLTLLGSKEEGLST